MTWEGAEPREDVLDLIRAYDCSSQPEFWRKEEGLVKLQKLRHELQELGGDIEHRHKYLLETGGVNFLHQDRLQAPLLREIFRRADQLERCPDESKLTLLAFVTRLFREAGVPKPYRERLRYARDTFK